MATLPHPCKHTAAPDSTHTFTHHPPLVWLYTDCSHMLLAPCHPPPAQTLFPQHRQASGAVWWGSGETGRARISRPSLDWTSKVHSRSRRPSRTTMTRFVSLTARYFSNLSLGPEMTQKQARQIINSFSYMWCNILSLMMIMIINKSHCFTFTVFHQK